MGSYKPTLSPMEAETVIAAVANTLKQGWRTTDIADAKILKEKILGTSAMGDQVCGLLKKSKISDPTALNTASFIASIS